MSAADRPKKRRRTANEYARTRLAVLRHIYRYGIGLAAVIELAFMGGKSAGHVLRRFAAAGLVTLESGVIPGGLSYATLTPAGGKAIGRVVKAKKPGSAALDLYVATAFYAVLSADNRRRYRLLPAEIKELSPGLPPNVVHVLSDDEDHPAVLRVQLAASGKPARVRDNAVAFFEKAKAEKSTADWVESKELGLVLLGHSPARVLQLQRAIKADTRLKDYLVEVALGPTAETLAERLRERRKTP